MAYLLAPPQELRPFVRLLWAADGAESTADLERRPAARRELMLPSTEPHLVVRLDGPGVELFDRPASGTGEVVGPAVVGGPRTGSYVRGVAPAGPSVGAVLAPGAAPALLGVTGRALLDRHTSLDDILGPRFRVDLQERLAAAPDLRGMCTVLGAALSARIRLHAGRGAHPVVATALRLFDGGERVEAVVRATGYSHRRFNVLFSDATGLTPKAFCRVRRIEKLLELLAARPEQRLSMVAVRAGFSDQAHLARDFRSASGMTLTDYRRRSITPGSRHVRLDVAPVPSS